VTDTQEKKEKIPVCPTKTIKRRARLLGGSLGERRYLSGCPRAEVEIHENSIKKRIRKRRYSHYGRLLLGGQADLNALIAKKTENKRGEELIGMSELTCENESRVYGKKRDRKAKSMLRH